MVLGDTYGIVSAGILLTDVVTGMSHTVAHLRWWTVVVVDAGHGLAAFGQIVGITRVRAWRTLALSIVIVGDTNSMRTALNALAGRSTR